jgi:NAD(P)-dependent dehydrogenase (short-subunit alcohol dehydrogenase family)
VKPDHRATLFRTKFVKCDTASWDDQVALFSTAARFSNSGKIDFVVANAGITKKDEVFAYDPSGPRKPDLKIIDVNIKGPLYYPGRYLFSPHQQRCRFLGLPSRPAVPSLQVRNERDYAFDAQERTSLW